MDSAKYINEYCEEMQRKNFRPNTIKNYAFCVRAFLYRFQEKDTPKHINEQDIKDYLRSFDDHNTQRAVHSAIKCFYKYVIRQPNKFRYIEYARRKKRLPIVHSVEEIQRLFDVIENKKHKAILAVMYACGLRVSEVINLRIADIDSSRKIINIIDAKGGKDRQVCLPDSLLFTLRDYYRAYRPKEYLFNGQFGPQYTASSINQFLKHYSEKAGLKKRIYNHLIRHDALTHLLEQGMDLRLIQSLLGHSNSNTTARYAHITDVVRGNASDRIERLMDGFELRWEED
jgi:site-specific recombinase XerD